MLERTPSTDTVCIELAGEPRGKARPRSRIASDPRTGRQWIHVYTDSESRAYEEALKAAAALAMHGRDLFSGPLCVTVIARFGVPASWSKRKQAAAIAGELRPTGRPDWDNLAKVTDALNGVVWRDDAQIVEGSIAKFYGADAGLLVVVRPVEMREPEAGAG